VIAPIRNDVASRLNGFLWARTILVPAITRGWSRRALWDVKMADVVVAVLGETSVEVVLPEAEAVCSCMLLRLVVGRCGGCRWRPSRPRFHR
jgi:hypothetical protein